MPLSRKEECALQLPGVTLPEQPENELLYDAEFKEMLGAYGKVQYLYEAGIEFVRGRLETLNNEFRVRHRDRKSTRLNPVTT